MLTPNSRFSAPLPGAMDDNFEVFAQAFFPERPNWHPESCLSQHVPISARIGAAGMMRRRGGGGGGSSGKGRKNARGRGCNAAQDSIDWGPTNQVLRNARCSSESTLGGSLAQDADYGLRPSAARSLISRTVGRTWALKARIWTIARPSGAEFGSETDAGAPAPIWRIGSGAPESISRPNSAPERRTPAQIRAVSGRNSGRSDLWPVKGDPP